MKLETQRSSTPILRTLRLKGNRGGLRGEKRNIALRSLRHLSALCG